MTNTPDRYQVKNNNGDVLASYSQKKDAFKELRRLVKTISGRLAEPYVVDSKCGDIIHH